MIYLTTAFFISYHFFTVFIFICNLYEMIENRKILIDELNSLKEFNTDNHIEIHFDLSKKNIELFERLNISLKIKNISKKNLFLIPLVKFYDFLRGTTFFLGIDPKNGIEANYIKSSIFMGHPEIYYSPIGSFARSYHYLPLKNPLFLQKGELKSLKYSFNYTPNLYGSIPFRIYLMHRYKIDREILFEYFGEEDDPLLEKFLDNAKNRHDYYTWSGKIMSKNVIYLKVRGIALENAIRYYSKPRFLQKYKINLNEPKNEKELLVQLTQKNFQKLKNEIFNQKLNTVQSSLDFNEIKGLIKNFGIFDILDLSIFFIFESIGSWCEKIYQMILDLLNLTENRFNILEEILTENIEILKKI